MVLLLFSCKAKDCICAKLYTFDNRISYSNPVCHPIQEIIGFNHLPLETVDYYYTKDCSCPPDIYFHFKEDSVGFWLASTDGNNIHRILPYNLNNPVWSHDGKNIAFLSEYGEIKIMLFNGENFDTTSIKTIKFRDSALNIAWSSDGRRLAFQNKGSNDSLRTGIWEYNLETHKTEFIYPKGKFPTWLSGSDALVFIASSAVHDSIISLNTTTGIKSLIKLQDRTTTVNRYNIKSSPDGRIIGFILYDGNDNSEQLYTINADGTNLKKLLDNFCHEFNWMTTDKIVYVSSEINFADKVKSTLWIMNQNGDSKQQLTYNNCQINNHYSK